MWLLTRRPIRHSVAVGSVQWAAAALAAPASVWEQCGLSEQTLLLRVFQHVRAALVKIANGALRSPAPHPLQGSGQQDDIRQFVTSFFFLKKENKAEENKTYAGCLSEKMNWMKMCKETVCFWCRPPKNKASVGINKANCKGFWLHSSETLFSSSPSRSLWSGQTLFYLAASHRFSGSHLKPVALYGWTSVCVIFPCVFFPRIWDFHMWVLQNCGLQWRPCCIIPDTPQNREDVCHPQSTATSALL